MLVVASLLAFVALGLKNDNVRLRRENASLHQLLDVTRGHALQAQRERIKLDEKVFDMELKQLVESNQ